MCPSTFPDGVLAAILHSKQVMVRRGQDQDNDQGFIRWLKDPVNTIAPRCSRLRSINLNNLNEAFQLHNRISYLRQHRSQI
jgi:hypothetical protein